MATCSTGDIKRRIKSVTSTEHITNAMKLVSASKLRKAKSTFEKTQKSIDYVVESIREIFNASKEVPERYLQGKREKKNTCYIIITSNRGLCGGFNSNIIRLAESEMQKSESNSSVIAIGSRGRDHFARNGFNIESEYLLPPEDISFLETHIISKPLIYKYENEEIDEIKLVYTSFASSLEQRPKIVQLLPFEPCDNDSFTAKEREVEYEPSVDEVFNYLIPKYVEMKIFGAIVESATCEHAARRIAMENATDNAREMLQELNLFYNRARQAAITNEISEIVGGAEALK